LDQQGIILFAPAAGAPLGPIILRIGLPGKEN